MSRGEGGGGGEREREREREREAKSIVGWAVNMFCCVYIALGKFV